MHTYVHVPRNCFLFFVVTILAHSRNHDKEHRKEEMEKQDLKATGLISKIKNTCFGRFLYCHRTININWNDNVIIALTSKIVVSSIIIIATFDFIGNTLQCLNKWVTGHNELLPSIMDSSFGPRNAKNHTFPTSIIWTPL